MSDPWTFGWNQVLTIAGLLITLGIALAGFRSFERWRREKIEEKRIDAAVDALVLIREMKWVFENIRSPASYDYEWQDMPMQPGEEENKRRSRGSFYAVLKRIEAHREFFDRAWKLQIRCGALFGQKADDALLLLQRARRQVEVSAGMLMRDPWPEYRTEDNKTTWEKFRTDVWGGDYGAEFDLQDTVGTKLEECRGTIEGICRPFLDRQYGKEKKPGFKAALSWLGL